jgi:hypothetical protein
MLLALLAVAIAAAAGAGRSFNIIRSVPSMHHLALLDPAIDFYFLLCLLCAYDE